MCLLQQEAVDWLSRHPLVLKSGIGIVGTSKGAGLALQMATESEKVVFPVEAFIFHTAWIKVVVIQNVYLTRSIFYYYYLMGTSV
jgi:BAAT / Acyl-CoA thioester hydrolase C terminal